MTRIGWRPITRALVLCIVTTAFVSLYLGLIQLSGNCSVTPSGDKTKRELQDTRSTTTEEKPKSDHKLAVVVPVRDRFEELLVFIPHMHNFLKAQNVDHHIFVVNQGDSLRFNRAALINIGYLESRLECDYIAMHDVDLLPLNDKLNYSYPQNGPYHVAAPHLHPLYHYSTFVGGILLIRGDHFKKVKGLSNRYWGWGKEDDEFYVRLKQANIQIHRPDDIGTGTKDTFRHLHDRIRRPRDRKRYGDQKKISRRRDYDTGVHNVKYTIHTQHELSIEGAPATVLNVHLFCDEQLTPWCVHPVPSA